MIGRYRLLEKLGEGGVAQVYRAHHPTLDCDVAIKVLHPRLVRRSDITERFQREAQAIARLRHPHIIRVYDFEIAGDMAYLVMEYVPGITLAKRLRDLRRAGRQMPFDEVWAIFSAVASAVEYAHQAGIIHRDIKPANVLLRSDGTPVLADFGMVYLAEDALQTIVEGMIGTPAYMSPEQCRGEHVDVRSDVYALGVLLFEMVTNRLPFEAVHPVQLLLKHLQEPPPYPGQFRPDVLPRVESAIMRSLAKSPDERFGSVRAFLRALSRDVPAVERVPGAALVMPSPLHAWAERQWEAAVKEAFQNYHDLVELVRSPLADAALIGPALINGADDPPPDERGRALRVVLRWAAARLAPGPLPYLADERPARTHPIWQDRQWWRYLILRYAYLEPFESYELDDGFRTTGTLIALLGFPNDDAFYAERDRALREVAFLLREQVLHRRSDAELAQLAVESLLHALGKRGQSLLAVAAVFRGPFPRDWLVEMARQEEAWPGASTLNYLLSQRIFQVVDDRSLILPQPIRDFVHARQPVDVQAARHWRAARFYQKRGYFIEAAWHLLMGGQHLKAADLLLGNAETLVDELEFDAMREALSEFSRHQLPPERWSDVQILLGDLWSRNGARNEALQVLESALRVAANDVQRGRIYLRLAKLFEDHNRQRALDYYNRADELLAPGHPERADLLTNRAWLYIYDRDWSRAESDLLTVLYEVEQPQAARGHVTLWRRRADVHNALASLYRQQKDYDRAIAHIQKAMALREENGDSRGVAELRSNLGLIYSRKGDLHQAVAAYHDAYETFRMLGSREAMATVEMDIGIAYHVAEHLQEAVSRYQKSLAIFREIDLPRGQSQAHYNLAEALTALGEVEAACYHWGEGYEISQRAGLDDELKWYEALRTEIPALAECASQSRDESLVTIPLPAAIRGDLSPDEYQALELVRQEGKVTTSRLMEVAHISRSTAKRVLMGLVERGVLSRRGQGRGIHYVLPASS